MTPTKPDRTLRWASGCLCAAWLAGMVGVVQVSAYKAPPSLMVFGAPVVWRGATAGFRAVVRDSASKAPQPETRLEAWLEDDTIAGPHITAQGEDAAAWTLSVPAFQGETARLVVRRHKRNSADPPTDVSIPVHVASGPQTLPAVLAPWASHAPTVSKHAPGVEVALVPTGGHFVVGLDNPGIGVVLRDAQPWRRVRVRCPALHLDVLTDDDGLFSFTYTPPLHPEPLRFFAGDDKTPMWLDLVPRVQVTQFQILVPANAFVRPEPLPLHIDALPLRDPLAVDLWLEDLLLGTTSVRVQERSFDVALSLKVALPEGFLTVVAFRHVLDAGATSAATRPMGSSAENVPAALLARHATDTWLQGRTHAPSERATLLALARLQTPHRTTPLMYDDAETVFERFEHHRQRVRSTIVQVMVAVMSLSLAIAAATVARMRRRMRQLVSKVVEGLPAEARVDPASAGEIVRVSNRLSLALAVVALLMSCYGLWAVAMRLRWS